MVDARLMPNGDTCLMLRNSKPVMILLIAFIVTLVPFTVEAKECDVESVSRKDCGFYGINQTYCALHRGCCFNSSAPQGVPWCYYSKDLASSLQRLFLCEHETIQNISCPVGNRIQVLNTFYGYQSGKRCHLTCDPGQHVSCSTCLNPKSKEVASKLCNCQSSCSINAGSKVWESGTNCDNFNNILEIDYRCIPEKDASFCKVNSTTSATITPTPATPQQRSTVSSPLKQTAQSQFMNKTSSVEQISRPQYSTSVIVHRVNTTVATTKVVHTSGVKGNISKTTIGQVVNKTAASIPISIPQYTSSKQSITAPHPFTTTKIGVAPSIYSFITRKTGITTSINLLTTSKTRIVQPAINSTPVAHVTTVKKSQHLSSTKTVSLKVETKSTSTPSKVPLKTSVTKVPVISKSTVSSMVQGIVSLSSSFGSGTIVSSSSSKQKSSSKVSVEKETSSVPISVSSKVLKTTSKLVVTSTSVSKPKSTAKPSVTSRKIQTSMPSSKVKQTPMESSPVSRKTSVIQPMTSTTKGTMQSTSTAPKSKVKVSSSLLPAQLSSSVVPVSKPGGGKKLSTGSKIAISVAVGVILLIMAVVVALCYRKRSTKRQFRYLDDFSPAPGTYYSIDPTMVQMSDLDQGDMDQSGQQGTGDGYDNIGLVNEGN